MHKRQPFTELEKMLAGELYNPADRQLTLARQKARSLLKTFNSSEVHDSRYRQELLRELIPSQGIGLYIEPPFYCDYGSNIIAGDKVYFNFNCVVLDVASVTIGDDVLFGPAVQVYTASHPMSWQERASGLEYGKSIAIGNNVWIGDGAIICPGVTIGQRSVVGAGSVVTRDIPPDVFAAGNPCRVIRRLDVPPAQV